MVSSILPTGPPAAPAPPPSRVIVFIDGANLFNSAKRRFGYKEPNADISKLAKTVVALKPNRKVEAIYYYIGVPKVEHDNQRHGWWDRKITAMGKLGVKTIRRHLKPRDLNIDISGIVHHKSTTTKLIEKGIDLRLGLDLVKYTLDQSFDVAIIFSQDGDLAEAVQDAFQIASRQRRIIIIECAYPVDGVNPRYGIRHATAIEFDRALYDGCLRPHEL
jgi:uncharacterized LabA/DUF88 family protein